MDNKSKIDQLHDMMPAHFSTRTNPNWSALIEAMGQSDQSLIDLMAEVRKQFFIKTAYRPYLDNLAANAGISRPLGVGMDDQTFKKYIPILAYTPKQVKLIIDQLLNIFFAKETTTAFISSGQGQPFALQDGWELQYTVDGIYDELIYFHASDFTDVNNATAQEIVAAINRQAQHSYAEDYYDNISKGFFVKIFSNTIGSKGSIQLVGGRANIVLQFNGFISQAGVGSNTEWQVTKIGDQVTFQYIGGASPGINLLQVGDVLVSLISGNVGSFPITSVNLANSSFSFKNLFGTPGTYTQTAATQTKFFTPNKYVVYTQNSRAVTWEVTPGEITAEMPATPPVVKRTLTGAMHINGASSNVVAYNTTSSLSVADASQFPMAGSFWLQEMSEIQTRYFTPTENTTNLSTFNGRLQGTPTKYTYASRLALQTTGSTVQGSNIISNLGSTAGIAAGQSVFMVGVPSYATVVAVIGNSVTMNFPATETSSSTVVQFAGNTLTGITPSLPALSVLNEFSLTSITRLNNVVTATTSVPHNFNVGDTVTIWGSSGIVAQTTPSGQLTLGSNQITGVTASSDIANGELVTGTGIPQLAYVQNVSGSVVTMTQSATQSGTMTNITFNEVMDGSYAITSATSNSFTFNHLGINGTAATAGTCRVDRIGLAPTGSLVVITGAQPSSFNRLSGSYVWNLSAPFVLSNNKATTVDVIQAGQIIPLLNLSANTIPLQGGYVVFDYGLNTQEGPVRYIYAPNNTSIVLDPSFVFQYGHSVGSTVTAIDNKGPHIMSGFGNEFAPYLTNPSDVRVTLEKLVQSVASAGIFIDFLVRYPEQLYGTLNVYQVTG